MSFDRLLSAALHHEITTDGVAASLLFSRQSPYGVEKASTRDDDCRALLPHRCGEIQNIYRGRNVGLDPGKRNIATMVDEKGLTLRYTNREDTGKCWGESFLPPSEVIHETYKQSFMIAKLTPSSVCTIPHHFSCQ